MASKILLGLIMGLLAGGAGKAVVDSSNSPLEAPASMEWLKFSAGAAAMVALVWIVATFINYPVRFGVFAIGEVIVGAFLAGFLSQQKRLYICAGALPVVVLAWIIL